MKARTGVILVVVALAVVLLASPAFAGQSGSMAQGGAQGTTGQRTQSRTATGEQTQQQTQEQLQDCVDSCERPHLKLQTRDELRIGENLEPAGDGRDRMRDRIQDADCSDETSDGVEPTETVEPTSTIEPTVAPEPDMVQSSSVAATDVVGKRAKIEQTGFMAWVRSVFARMGL